MIDEKAATAAVKQYAPKGRIEGPIDYRGLFIFQVFHDDDELEGMLDPFVSVDQNGKVNDFALFAAGNNVNDILDLFAEKQS